jgi:hypothetical protein
MRKGEPGTPSPTHELDVEQSWNPRSIAESDVASSVDAMELLDVLEHAQVVTVISSDDEEMLEEMDLEEEEEASDEDEGHQMHG